MGEPRDVCKNLCGITEEHLEDLNIDDRLILKGIREIGYGSVDWIHLRMGTGCWFL
jgi:hypothetical protein